MICATLNEPWCLFFSRDTDAEHKCIADVVPGWRGEWFQLMIKGDSELVGSSYQEALGYISSLWSTNTTQVIRMVDNFHYRLQKMSLSDLPSNEKARYGIKRKMLSSQTLLFLSTFFICSDNFFQHFHSSLRCRFVL